MTDIAIHVENLSKLYRIGRAQQRHDTLRDALVSTLKRPALSLSKGQRCRVRGRRDADVDPLRRRMRLSFAGGGAGTASNL